MRCKRCGGDKVYKNGNVSGRQRYKCQLCNYQFVPETSRGVDKITKLTACLLYASGFPLRKVGQFLNVSATSVLNWVKAYSVDDYEKMTPSGDAVVVQLDQIPHYFPQQKPDNDSGMLAIILKIDSVPENMGVIITSRTKHDLI